MTKSSNKKFRTRFDDLGDRMKVFEHLEAGRKLMPSLPIVARLDGRSFHSFTRGMSRPYYEPMSLAMIETARYLVDETHACFAYTQSDEITLVYRADGPQAETMFGGRLQKLTSILAATATAKFNAEVAARMPERSNRLPVFDARVFNMPSLDDVMDCVLFRVLDCAKNSITMAASAFYSHKELHGKSGSDKHEMLHAKGVNWASYPSFFKDGTFLKRVAREKLLSPAELARIPEARRPSGPVLRSAVVELELPPFARLANPKDVLFFGEAPRLRTASIEQEADVLLT